MLEARGVRIAFGGVLALDDAAVRIEPGRVTGLIGRNGSGKSTLFNCITGFLRPASGAILLDGQPITGLPPHEIVRRGVARTFQTPRVDPNATLLDAVMCGLHATVRQHFIQGMLALPTSRREERALLERAEAVIARLQMQRWTHERMSTLSMGRVRMVDVARAIATGARYLLLDEPAAGLSRDEQGVLAREIRLLAAAGIGVLLVEHNFSLIRMLCDSVTVLDSGRILRTGSPEDVERDDEVISLYLGATAAEPALE